MKGYIIIEDKQGVICDGEIFQLISKAMARAYHAKDDYWDSTDRHKVKWHIMNLKNGKVRQLKGWKTEYIKFTFDVAFDGERTDTNWYTDEQIKKLEESLK